ncbi:hypothetical protein ACJJTC_007129 [Scirpophaga incertulas]
MKKANNYFYYTCGPSGPRRVRPPAANALLPARYNTAMHKLHGKQQHTYTSSTCTRAVISPRQYQPVPCQPSRDRPCFIEVINKIGWNEVEITRSGAITARNAGAALAYPAAPAHPSAYLLARSNGR